MDAEAHSEAINLGADFANAKLSISIQFGIKSAFVRVADLSKMLGIPSNTIHALIRQHRFPIPHRQVGSVVLVKFDDYVAWYCQGDAFPCMPVPKEVKKLHSKVVEGPIEPSVEDVLNEVRISVAFEETAKERAARYKREAHDALRRKGLLR